MKTHDFEFYFDKDRAISYLKNMASSYTPQRHIHISLSQLAMNTGNMDYSLEDLFGAYPAIRDMDARKLPRLLKRLEKGQLRQKYGEPLGGYRAHDYVINSNHDIRHKDWEALAIEMVPELKKRLSDTVGWGELGQDSLNAKLTEISKSIFAKRFCMEILKTTDISGFLRRNAASTYSEKIMAAMDLAAASCSDKADFEMSGSLKNVVNMFTGDDFKKTIWAQMDKEDRMKLYKLGKGAGDYLTVEAACDDLRYSLVTISDNNGFLGNKMKAELVISEMRRLLPQSGFNQFKALLESLDPAISNETMDEYMNWIPFASDSERYSEVNKRKCIEDLYLKVVNRIKLHTSEDCNIFKFSSDEINTDLTSLERTHFPFIVLKDAVRSHAEMVWRPSMLNKDVQEQLEKKISATNDRNAQIFQRKENGENVKDDMLTVFDTSYPGHLHIFMTHPLPDSSPVAEFVFPLNNNLGRNLDWAMAYMKDAYEHDSWCSKDDSGLAVNGISINLNACQMGRIIDMFRETVTFDKPRTVTKSNTVSARRSSPASERTL